MRLMRWEKAWIDLVKKIFILCDRLTAARILGVILSRAPTIVSSMRALTDTMTESTDQFSVIESTDQYEEEPPKKNTYSRSSRSTSRSGSTDVKTEDLREDFEAQIIMLKNEIERLKEKPEEKQEMPEDKIDKSQEKPEETPVKSEESEEERQGRRGRATAPSGNESPLEDDGTTSSCSTAQATDSHPTARVEPWTAGARQWEPWATTRMVIVREWPQYGSPWDCLRCGAQWCRIRQPPARPPDGVLTRAGLNELGMSELKQTKGLKMLDLKKVTNCSVCGGKGHWKGDPECNGVRDG